MDILSIGVIPMNAYFGRLDSKTDRSQCSAQMFLLFLTGNVLGGLLVRHFAISGSVFSGIVDKGSLSLYYGADFPEVLLSVGKFLLLLYLLSFQRWGAMLVPPVFGIEGICFGISICGLISDMGPRGAVAAFLLMLFRLLVVLPYGFLLGGWSVERSLDFPHSGDKGSAMGVLAVTLAVMLLAAFLECSLARWLGGMYYLKFGV